MNSQCVNPPELFDSEPVGFSQIVVAQRGDHSIHMSGQVAWNAKREVIGPGDLYMQVLQSLRNIEIGLQYTDATLSNVVSLRIYIRASHISDSASVTRALKEVFAENQPCATWIGVPTLAQEEFLVEIEPTIIV